MINTVFCLKWRDIIHSITSQFPQSCLPSKPSIPDTRDATFAVFEVLACVEFLIMCRWPVVPSASVCAWMPPGGLLRGEAAHAALGKAAGSCSPSQFWLNLSCNTSLTLKWFHHLLVVTYLFSFIACIIQGSPEKHKLSYKELGPTGLETDLFQDLKSAGWRPRRADGLVPIWVQKPETHRAEVVTPVQRLQI